MTSTTSPAAKAAPSSQRPRYYARQVVTADDLNLEQQYFREKLRRHNRLLHGFGVVCGVDVIAGTDPYMVTVKCGALISPEGDDITIPRDVGFDVRRQCTAPPETQDASDPWCKDPTPPPPKGALHIAVRYLQKKDRLVRVPAGGCSCDVDGCEFTRWTDWYEICVIDHCPDSHLNPPKFQDLFPPHGAAPPCPPCPTEPWVVIAKVTVDDAGKVTVNQCACRRQVTSFAGLWWSCQNPNA
jgi:hypothetical protein